MILHVHLFFLQHFALLEKLRLKLALTLMITNTSKFTVHKYESMNIDCWGDRALNICPVWSWSLLHWDIWGPPGQFPLWPAVSVHVVAIGIHGLKGRSTKNQILGS